MSYTTQTTALRGNIAIIIQSSNQNPVKRVNLATINRGIHGFFGPSWVLITTSYCLCILPLQHNSFLVSCLRSCKYRPACVFLNSPFALRKMIYRAYSSPTKIDFLYYRNTVHCGSRGLPSVALVSRSPVLRM